MGHSAVPRVGWCRPPAARSAPWTSPAGPRRASDDTHGDRLEVRGTAQDGSPTQVTVRAADPGHDLLPGSWVRVSNSVWPFGHFGILWPSLTWTFSLHLAQW